MKKKGLLSVISIILCSLTIQAQPKLNTKLLTLEGDIASHLVEGVDNFLLNELANSVKKREETHKMAEANRAFSHFRW